MNQIDTSQILDPTSQQPFSGKSLTFLQNASKEMLSAYVYAMFGEVSFGLASTRGLAVSGCTKSGSGNTIFYGYIYYNGELYYFPGQTGLNSYSNVPVVVADTNYDFTIDPVKFSDGAMKNVHQVRRLKVVDQVSGTGLFDLSNLIRIISESSLTGTSTNTSSAALTAIPNSSFTTPNRICDLEITSEGTITASSDGSAGAQGGSLIIYNVTTSTQVSNRSILVQNMPNTYAVFGNVFSRVILRGVPASTTFQLYCQRQNTADVTVTSPIITWKEILRPKLW